MKPENPAVDTALHVLKGAVQKVLNAAITTNVYAEAETRFGNAMYDKYPVPAHVQQLSITLIKDWNVNYCLGSHLATTGELGELKIIKHRSRPSRKELEISFEVSPQQNI